METNAQAAAVAAEELDRQQEIEAAAEKLAKVMRKASELVGERMIQFAKNNPCVRQCVAHRDDEIFFIFRHELWPPDETETIIELVAIEHQNVKRMQGRHAFYSGRGWQKEMRRCVVDKFNDFFRADVDYWHGEIKSELNIGDGEEKTVEEAAAALAEKQTGVFSDSTSYLTCRLCNQSNEECRLDIEEQVMDAIRTVAPELNMWNSY